MFDAQDTDPLPLPPQYDAVLAAGAVLGYGGLAAFLLTQTDAGLRVGWEVTFGFLVWCLSISAPAAICWMARPQITHVTYAMRLALALDALPDAPHIVPPRASFAARHWVWGSCGMIGACAWTLGAAMDVGAATGRLLLAAHALNAATMVLGQLGAVAISVRIMGPSLAAVDDIYRAARGDIDTQGAKIIKLRPRKKPRRGGEEGYGLRGEAR